MNSFFNFHKTIPDRSVFIGSYTVLCQIGQSTSISTFSRTTSLPAITRPAPSPQYGHRYLFSLVGLYVFLQPEHSVATGTIVVLSSDPSSIVPFVTFG